MRQTLRNRGALEADTTCHRDFASSSPGRMLHAQETAEEDVNGTGQGTLNTLVIFSKTLCTARKESIMNESWRNEKQIPKLTCHLPSPRGC